jgi:hypothetical protein
LFQVSFLIYFTDKDILNFAQAKADPNITMGPGKCTPLYIAAQGGFLAIVMQVFDKHKHSSQS